MIKKIDSLKLTFLYELIQPLVFKIELYFWNRRKKLPPTPQIIKHKIVKEMAKKYAIKTLVETGTYLGNMVNANKNNFERVYSIELDPKLFKRAKRKFAKLENIHLKQGDSEKILPQILKKIDKPALFWLDAHYSGKLTAKGKLNSPIVSELKFIFADKFKKHIILIDDANYFKGEGDYPTIADLKNLILKKNPAVEIQINHNIIYILPSTLS